MELKNTGRLTVPQEKNLLELARNRQAYWLGADPASRVERMKELCSEGWMTPAKAHSLITQLHNQPRDLQVDKPTSKKYTKIEDQSRHFGLIQWDYKPDPEWEQKKADWGSLLRSVMGLTQPISSMQEVMQKAIASSTQAAKKASQNMIDQIKAGLDHTKGYYAHWYSCEELNAGQQEFTIEYTPPLGSNPSHKQIANLFDIKQAVPLHVESSNADQSSLDFVTFDSRVGQPITLELTDRAGVTHAAEVKDIKFDLNPNTGPAEKWTFKKEG